MQDARSETAAVTTLSARYVVYGEIASGGMASVQYGRLLGPQGFSRAVAIKRLHPHLAKDPDTVAMFVDEARLTARLVHANIVHTLDVIETPTEIALVMEYVHGESLWNLFQLARARGELIPVGVACSLITSVLWGLHAAHEACSHDARPLGIVHRDVSPQNILVGVDGIPRLLDFGIAQARGRTHSTRQGEIKGKLSYIACEQMRGVPLDRRTDVYGASVVLWEALTGMRLFDGPSEQAVVHNVLHAPVEPPSAHRTDSPRPLDALVLRGLCRDASGRFASAQDFAVALENTVGLASQSEIAAWLRSLAGLQLDERMRSLRAVDGGAPSSALNGMGLAHTRRLAPPSTCDATQKTTAARVDASAREPERTPELAGSLRDSGCAVPKASPVQRSITAWRAVGAAVMLLVISVWFTLGATRAAHEAESEPPRVATPLTVGDVAQPSAATDLAPQPPVAAPLPVVAASATEHPRHAVPSAASVTGDGATKPARRARPAHSARLLTAPTVVPKRRPPQRASERSPAADPCVPYYRLDERGIRHPKPECI